MPKTARPITLTLTADEATMILTPVGEGGQQSFQQELIEPATGRQPCAFSG